jgi:HSP90 family molecular chaperone
MAGEQTADTFDVHLQFAPRVIAEHLGKQKYSTSTRAIGELVANAFDAAATWVDISVQENALGGVESFTVSDNGSGMTRDVLKERFGMVGVGALDSGSTDRLGRFGVGRLGVFRIGSMSEWSTVAVAADGSRHRLSFIHREDTPTRFRVTDVIADSAEPTGTRVRVSNVYDSGSERPTENRVVWDISVMPSDGS